MAKTPEQRRARSLRRVKTLISQGRPFNPAGVSPEARSHAAGNARTLSGSFAAGAITGGKTGTASAPKGGPVRFHR